MHAQEVESRGRNIHINGKLYETLILEAPLPFTSLPFPCRKCNVRKCNSHSTSHFYVQKGSAHSDHGLPKRSEA